MIAIENWKSTNANFLGRYVAREVVPCIRIIDFGGGERKSRRMVHIQQDCHQSSRNLRREMSHRTLYNIVQRSNRKFWVSRLRAASSFNAISSRPLAAALTFDERKAICELLKNRDIREPLKMALVIGPSQIEFSSNVLTDILLCRRYADHNWRKKALISPLRFPTEASVEASVKALTSPYKHAEVYHC